MKGTPHNPPQWRNSFDGIFPGLHAFKASNFKLFFSSSLTSHQIYQIIYNNHTNSNKNDWDYGG